MVQVSPYMITRLLSIMCRHVCAAKAVAVGVSVVAGGRLQHSHSDRNNCRRDGHVQTRRVALVQTRIVYNISTCTWERLPGDSMELGPIDVQVPPPQSRKVKPAVQLCS